MQLAPQTVDKLQDAAGFGFDNRLHDQLATAVEDRGHNRFVVHVHADTMWPSGLCRVAIPWSCIQAFQ